MLKIFKIEWIRANIKCHKYKLLTNKDVIIKNGINHTAPKTLQDHLHEWTHSPTQLTLPSMSDLGRALNRCVDLYARV